MIPVVKCVILQPSYIPWRGYFHQIQKADVFVFYDCVQFDRHGWRNRNRIKTAQGTQWLTIPVLSKGHLKQSTSIRRIPICWNRDWNATHWSILSRAYGDAPFFSQYAPAFEKAYASHPELLADFTIELTVTIAQQLGLNRTQFIRSSALGAEGAKTDRVIDILKKVRATHYISGPAAKSYLDHAKFDQAHIGVECMEYLYPEYEQLHPPFDPQVSILDLLFMKGPQAPSFIW